MLLDKRKKTIIVICSVLVVIGLLLLAIWGISSAVVDNGYRTEDLFTEETQPYEKVDIVPRGKDREEVMSKINRLDYKNIEDVEKDSIENTFNFIKKYFVKADKEESIEFGIAAIDPGGSLYTSWYDYSKKDIDIKKNYNNDFEAPYEKICSLIEEEGEASLMLFYGEPGTGKSTVIKHLIGKYPDKDFIFMDGALLCNVGQEKLMSYFLDNNDTIFILEDCEKSLANRDHNFNPVMPVLLNITDGIIADVLGIKLICTFNTALSNIDPALKRKGRLSMKYEFRKLAKDKCQEIVNTSDLIKEKFTVTEDMTLAELYNHDDENDYSKNNTKKIGF